MGKKQRYLTIILIMVIIALIQGCSSFGFNESDQVISTNDLPEAVKPLAEKETSGCKIINIEKETRGGKIIYAITYDQAGIEMEIEYTPDGILISKAKE